MEAAPCCLHSPTAGQQLHHLKRDQQYACLPPSTGVPLCSAPSAGPLSHISSQHHAPACFPPLPHLSLSAGPKVRAPVPADPHPRGLPCQRRAAEGRRRCAGGGQRWRRERCRPGRLCPAGARRRSLGWRGWGEAWRAGVLGTRWAGPFLHGRQAQTPAQPLAWRILGL